MELSDLSQNLNVLLNRLSAISVIGLPLVFITALFGMNVPLPGEVPLRSRIAYKLIL